MPNPGGGTRTAGDTPDVGAVHEMPRRVDVDT
jgi:hypothetical protein